MSVAIKLGNDVVWGTSSLAPGTTISTIGKVLSCTSKSTAKVTEQEDENGELYAAIFSDQREEITLEILVKPSAVKPAPGTLITVAGVTDFIVKESDSKWASAASQKFTITGFKSLK